jgi:hypothetical protein
MRNNSANRPVTGNEMPARLRSPFLTAEMAWFYSALETTPIIVQLPKKYVSKQKSRALSEISASKSMMPSP